MHTLLLSGGSLLTYYRIHVCAWKIEYEEHFWFYILFSDDLSYKKLASQLHTTIGPYYNASNAIDGNLATCMRTLPIGYNNPENTVWWKVDLGAVYNIYSINIIFKNTDFEGRIDLNK